MGHNQKTGHNEKTVSPHGPTSERACRIQARSLHGSAETMTDDDNTQLILVSRIETRWDTLDFDPPIPLAKAESIGLTLVMDDV
jgi:hypothetical protein